VEPGRLGLGYPDLGILAVVIKVSEEKVPGRAVA